MLERPSTAPLFWEVSNTEAVVREQVLQVEPDIVLFQELPGMVPFVETHSMIPANPKSHSGHLATLVRNQLATSELKIATVDGCAILTTFVELDLTIANVHLPVAETELSWTTMTSPIAGRADVSTVSVGDLVTAGQADALTSIVTSDPIYVDMMEASARILSVRSAIAEGDLQQNDTLQATLTLENGDIYRGTGQLVTPGNNVSTSTGTVTIRFTFDNPDHIILPGMFVRGEIVLGTMQAYLVPQRAATRGNSGKLTAYVIGEDGKAEQVTLEDDGTYQNAWIVRMKRKAKIGSVVLHDHTTPHFPHTAACKLLR